MILSFVELLFSLLGNNILELIISLILLCTNLYSKVTKNYQIDVALGDESKENIKLSDKLSFFYKVKFVFYFLGSILYLVFLLFEAIYYFFEDEEDGSYFFNSLVIYGGNKKAKNK